MKTLRIQAWLRAKAELESVLHTFWTSEQDGGKWAELSELTEQFIRQIEDNGLTD